MEVHKKKTTTAFILKFFRNEALIVCFAALSVLTCNATNGSSGEKPSAEAKPQAHANKATSPLPVILLTGFEPFGNGRPANPSWEGIASLNGQQLHGYRLVCKQIRVVWGAPREQLQQSINEFHPVAIFSFGQGGTGSFSLESKALNRRSRIPDNLGAFPPGPAIVEGGPAEFNATAEVGDISRLLSLKGYHVRVSTDAGHYLCEEALYSLEYLKIKNKLDSVSFCHVPPLGTQIGKKPVTAEYVQQFVKDEIEIWCSLRQKTKPASPTGERN